MLRVYGPDFVRDTEVIGILLAGVLAYSYAKQLLNTLNAVDRPDLAFRANAVFSAMNVVLNVVLIAYFGWVGAAVATALSAVIGLAISFGYARRIIPFSVPIVEIGRQWLAALSIVVVVLVLRRIGEDHWLSGLNELFVAGLVVIGAACYLAVLPTISPEFTSTVYRNLPIDSLVERAR